MSNTTAYPSKIDDEYLQDIYCAITTDAINNNWTIGDKIKRITEIDQEVGEVIHFYNVTTGANIPTGEEPVIGTDIGVCPEPASVEQEILVDKLASGEQTKFIRKYVISEDGTTSTVIDTELDGTTSYTVSGTVQHEHTRENSTYEGIAITDSSIVSLTVPAGANFAEIVFKSTGINAAIAMNDTDGVPDVTNDKLNGYLQPKEQQFTLQGVDELENFQAIALSGFSGRLDVNYKFDYKTKN